MIGITPTAREIEETTEQLCSLLVFQLAGQAFALRIETVAQIIPMLRLTPVPQVDGTIEGVANIHGKIVPVISARRRLGLPYLEPGLYTPIILTRAGDRHVGWIVDEVTDVISVPAESITMPGDILPEGQEETQVMNGLVYQLGQSIVVLDPRSFLRPSQFRMINRAVHTNTPPVEPRPALNENDSDRWESAPASTSLPFEAVPTAQVVKGNGNGNGHGNSKPLPVAPVETVTPAQPPAVPQLPAAPDPASPAAEPPAEEAPTEEVVKKAKSTRRGNGKGKIIPATASSVDAEVVIQPRSTQRIMQSMMDRQFAALADELQETEAQPSSAENAGTISTQA